MKAEELMVGDWMKYSGTPMRVSGRIIADLEFNELNCIEREGFEPIPITPEILVKNGFTTDGFSYILMRTTYAVELRVFHDARWWDMKISSLEDGSHLKDKSIKYVHQLQHFMRDFEIEKEITL